MHCEVHTANNGMAGYTHCFEASVVYACEVQRVGSEMAVARQIGNNTGVLVEDMQELHRQEQNMG